MFRRKLNCNVEYENILEQLKKQIRKDYRGSIKLSFDSDRPAGYSEVNVEPYVRYPVRGLIGANGIYVEGSKNILRDDVTELDVTGVVVAAFHECRHAVVTKAMGTEDGVRLFPDIAHMSVTHLSTLGNPKYMFDNWNKLITEVDAERFGIEQAGLFLADYYGDDKAERMLLDYVNDRNKSGKYILRNDGLDGHKYDNLSDVYDDLDLAYERAKRVPRSIQKSDNGLVSYVKSDVSSRFFASAVSERVQYEFISQKDGFAQDKMMAAIVLHQRPEYRGYHAVLRDVDMTLNAVLGTRWNDIDEHFESPVEKKVVPEGVRKIQEQEAYHNKLLAKPDFSQNRNLREIDKSGQSDGLEF